MIDHAAHQRIDIVEKTLGNHLEHIEKLEKAIQDNTMSLGENTRLTQEIATSNKRVEDNTAELVELFKGAKAVRKFMLWISPLVVIISTFVYWLFGRK